ncbi:MAG: hypothetical protein H8E41_09625 [Desulfobulbaceae bacterium]|uniref:Uncharacterized protein n=1 Tax=Candidatus Desulfobia pelagia TaxID=2841692 RepID=A0A8J6TCI3_9BACT|nr:hypothetical protein [Candidatus Desulfobia pelagia]
MGLKPLGIVKEIVESIGMEISYAYDDLVFMEHNAFLLQFTEKENELLIHMNRDADETELKNDIARLKKAASVHLVTFNDGTTYTLSQADDDNIRIEFAS